MTAPNNQGNSNIALGKLIASTIAEVFCGQMPFANFMDLVLYHPEQGYYASQPTVIGARGDFVTAPHLGVDFGELLATQFVEMWQRLGQPRPFTLLEMGAGQGILASDVLRYLQQQPALWASLDYVIVERAPAMIAAQKQQLATAIAAGAQVRWCPLEQLAAESLVGCFFSNELVDALPVHQFVWQNDQLHEVHVALKETPTDHPEFVEVLAAPSTEQLAAYLDLCGVELARGGYPAGYRSEIHLAALDWMQTVARILQRGYVLTIDYGYPAERYYLPSRSQGTLQCYYQQSHHNDPYRYLGRQDITAHVNFTALERQGERCGLQTEGFTQQALFLMALGLGDRLQALGQSEATDPKTVQTILQRRQALQSLIDPLGLGNFGVLLQSKGMPVDAPPLRGFAIPQ